MRRFLHVLDALDEKMGIWRAQRIHFAIGSWPATLTREWWLGRVLIHFDDRIIELQEANIGFSMRTTRRWEREIAGHSVEVEITSQRPFPAFRPVKYRIIVDGEVVKEEARRF